MANFDFLRQTSEYAVFAEPAIEAEKQYNKSPMFCGIAARKAVEQAVNWMYSIDRDLRKPYDDGIQALVHESSFMRIVPYDICKDIQIVIKVGNKAVHSHIAVEKQYALLSLKALFNFLHWIDYTYGGNYQPRIFDESAIPASKVQIVIKAKQADIDAYKDQLDEKDKTIQELKLLLAQTQKEIESRKFVPKEKPLLSVAEINEADTRRLFIDEDLRAMGWKLDQVMVQTEYPVHNMGANGGDGRVDYVLFGKDRKPLAVIEAKRTSKDPNVGKQQAVDYADCLEREYKRRPFIFYTNGFDYTFWDDTEYVPRSVSMVFSQGDLQRLMDRRTQRQDLHTIEINQHITERYYQKAAIKAVINAVFEKRRKFLLVMATGTGKTRTVISLSDVLSRANYISNMLFLTDRIQLVKQAYNAFKTFLSSMTLCNMLDPKERESNKNARIVFSTYPTILNAIDSDKNDDGERLYTPAHFDLIVIDEAHRSIFKKYRAIFDYFDAYLVGLTATPRDELERERSTFEFFGVEHGNPTYNYSYNQAIKDKYLVPFYPIEVSTTFMDNGIHYDDLTEEDKLRIQNEYAEEGKSTFEEEPPSAINDYVFNKDTVQKVLTELMQNGIRSQAGDVLGKTIIFAYNKRHAKYIVETFDEMYPEYKGKYAARIVCDDSRVEQTIADFEKPNSSLRIAVSVDMLDTGVDIPDVVNLVFFKKVRSYIKFWQMIGRGTRKCDNLECTDAQNGTYVGKKHFYIFDWLRNFEFFRENAKGIPPAVPTSLTEVIFKKRVQLIQILQDAQYSDDEHIALRNELVALVHKQVEALANKQHTVSVHLHLRAVLQFLKKESFICLSDDDVSILSEELAPLVYMDEQDFFAKGFDNIVYTMIINKMQEKSFASQQMQIIGYANALLKKASIDQVKAQMPLLQTVHTSTFYKDADVLDFEKLRLGMRDLIKFLDEGTDFKIKYVNYIDTIVNLRRGIPIDSSGDYKEYEKRVNAYILEHLSDESIFKLRTNEKLTESDYKHLNEIFTKELGNKEQFDTVRNGKSLGVFVRSIAKMDRQAVNALFSEFITENNLTIQQIDFVKVIIENIIEQGQINLSRLADGKPPFDRPQKFFVLFGTEVQSRMITLIRAVNDNAEVA